MWDAHKKGFKKNCSEVNKNELFCFIQHNGILVRGGVVILSFLIVLSAVKEGYTYIVNQINF